MRDILILAHGMGSSSPGDCFALATQLYPDAEQFSKSTRRWLQFPDGSQKYLLEVYYEDLNQTVASKYKALWDATTGQLSEKMRGPVESCVSDVAQNVLVDSSIDQVQSRFVAKYLEARLLAQALAGPSLDPTTIPIGVLAHSLGTLAAYEGLFRAADVASDFSLHPVSLVVCAPMWSAIRKVQVSAHRRRYLVDRGFTKPGRFNPVQPTVFEPLVKKCTAIYHTSDPFLLIQNRSDYTKGAANNGLIDEFVLVDSGDIPKPSSHFMGGSYLTAPESRTAVLRGLAP